MKIFATSDIHGSKTIADKLKLIAPRADLILICGDIGGKEGSGKTFQQFSAYQKQDAYYLCSVLSQTGTTGRFILGNDDWFDFEGSYYLAQPQVIQGLNFIPFEFVLLTPFNTNREVNENKLTYELRKLKADENSIIVAHTPPLGAGDTLHNGSHCGSWAVREWIKEIQPKIWFCGHIHENNCVIPIRETLVFNCACQYTDGLLKGWLVDTDTMDYEAVVL